jgi:hypothetical protein
MTNPLLTLSRRRRLAHPALCVFFTLGSGNAAADAVTQWNERVCDIVAASGLPTEPASRLMAIVQTAVLHAVEPAPAQAAQAGAALEAAVAAAHRTVLHRLLPAQRAAVDAAYDAALAQLPAGSITAAAIAHGERAASQVLDLRANDGADAVEAHRPFTAPGRYVPAIVPAVPHWPQRTPWLMTRADQFRPAGPPSLDSDRWARDFQETKAYGAKASTLRSPAQSDVARFWQTTAPLIYHGLVRSVALQPGRELVRNARLFAAVAQGIDDGMIAGFDAKYHHGFWRPLTAVRNADIDGNDATQRDPAWLPLLPTPPHPEYPCAHCIQSAVVATVIRADVGDAAMPPLSTHSPTAQGARREWSTPQAVVEEVATARIHGGMHYRFSTEAGAVLGQRIGALAAARHLAR